MKNLQAKILASAVLVGFSLAGGNVMAASAQFASIPASSCKSYSPTEASHFETIWGTMKNTSSAATWIQCGISEEGAVLGLGDPTTTQVDLKLDHGTTFAAYNCYIARQDTATGKREVVTNKSNTLVSGYQNAPVFNGNTIVAPKTALDTWTAATAAIAKFNTYVAGCLIAPNNTFLSVEVSKDITK